MRSLPPELHNLPETLRRMRPRDRARLLRNLQIDRLHWERVRRAERGYTAQLRQVARHVNDMVNAFTRPLDLNQLPELQQLLDGYGRILEPWARATAERMIAEVTRRDAVAWFKVSREIGVGLRQMIENAPIGGVIRQLVDDQVQLITSLPIEAGRRVQYHTQEFVMGGKRYDELVDIVRASGDVTTTRATLIARTETAKAQSAIVQARAQHIGSEHYVWHSVRDSAVRPMHRHLDGSIQRWDSPPVAEENGERHHPGNFPNCRCYSEPVINAVIT